MDDERERGRVASWRARLDRTIAFAETLLPTFSQMHREARPTLRSYADWLNERDFKNENGRVWRSETVARMFSLDLRARDLIEKQHNRETARLRYLKRDTSEAERTTAAYIAHVAELARRLRGPWTADRQE